MIILSSCGVSKEVAGGNKVDKVKDDALFQILDSLSSQKFDSFYAKISTHYKDSSRSIGFKTSLRMYEDSILNTTMSLLGVPVFQCLITQDSLKMTNKTEKCYVGQKLSYFKDLLGVEFSYSNAQELFLGQPIDYDPSKVYYRTNDAYSYTICSHSKRDIRKNDKAEKREIIKYYTLSKDLTTLKSMEIYSPEDNIVIYVFFDERIQDQGMGIPSLTRMEIKTPSQDIFVEMNYKKYRLNSSETIHFVIPDSYEECK